MPELETTRLRLRMFTPDDLDAYHERIHGNAEVMESSMPGGKPETRAFTEDLLDYFIGYWNDHPLGVWAVEDKASGHFIGHCGLLYFRGTPDVEVLYALDKDYWGKGLAAEAAYATLGYGFETAKLERIYAVAFPENKASQRVMQKIGMHSEGITNRFYNTEMACYSISREEYAVHQA